MKRGRKKLEEKNPLDNSIYSSFIFAISSEINYPKAISDHLKRNAGNVWNQLNYLYKNNFITYVIVGDEKVFPFEKKIYSVNWEKIIGELLIQLRKKIENVLEEIKENHLDFNKIFTNFGEIISRATDKNFEEKIKKNKYLITFLKAYFSYIAKSRATKTTISEAFSFLFYFENFNFIEVFENSSPFYNLENIQIALAIHHEYSKKKSEIAKNSSKQDFPKREDEVSELKEAFKKENLKKDSDLEDLFLLGEIFKVVKFKPSLKIGLGEGVASVGKELVKNNFTNEEIKQYFDYFYFGSLGFDYEEQIRKELSELIGEEIPQKHFLVKGKIIDKEEYEEFKRMYPNEPED